MTCTRKANSDNIYLDTLVNIIDIRNTTCAFINQFMSQFILMMYEYVLITLN